MDFCVSLAGRAELSVQNRIILDYFTLVVAAMVNLWSCRTSSAARQVGGVAKQAAGVFRPLAAVLICRTEI